MILTAEHQQHRNWSNHNLIEFACSKVETFEVFHSPAIDSANLKLGILERLNIQHRLKVLWGKSIDRFRYFLVAQTFDASRAGPALETFPSDENMLFCSKVSSARIYIFVESVSDEQDCS